MESCVRALGVAIAVALCSALTVGLALAQEQAPKAGSDRDALHTDGVGIGDGGAIIGGADVKRNEFGGGRGAGQSRSGEGDTARPGLPNQAGPGADASRKGTIAPAGAFGATLGNQGTALNLHPVRLEGGLTGLQHRANRRTLIANAPKCLWGHRPIPASVHQSRV
jgi:hypothetical protein